MKLNALQGRARWLLLPAHFAASAGVALVVFHCALTIDFPRASLGPFIGTVTAAVLTFNTLSHILMLAHLQPLQALNAGVARPTRGALIEAALAAAALPERVFWVVLSAVLIGATLSTGGWMLLDGATHPPLLRVVSAGVCMAPLAAALAFVVTVPRARVVHRQLLEAGLPVTDLYRALKKHLLFERRWLACLGIAVATPLALAVDLGVWRYERAVAGVSDAPLWAIVTLLGLTLLMVGVLTVRAGAALGEPLEQLAAETTRLLAGRYGAPRFIAAEYETRAAAAAIATMELQLAELLGGLDGAAVELSEATLSLAADDVAGRAQLETQRSLLDATGETTQALARSAYEIASSAQRVTELATATLLTARAGRDSADGFLRAMAEVREGNRAIADSVVRLNKRVQQVGRVVEFIDGIADKSDLLALNAELEGNKAGDAGRGFSLVAAEMRRLAESVMSSTREISGLIEEIRDATNAAVMATEAGVKTTDSGTTLAARVSEGFSRIVDHANQSSTATQSINLATSQQQVGTDQLVSAMREILQGTEVSAATAEEMRQAHDRLIALARDLTDTVTLFEAGAQVPGGEAT